MSETGQSVYEAAGGDGPIALLVEHFYRGVEGDPVLRPMYPDDLAEAREHLFLFLTQLFGGPRRYEERRGHPRLRMRHFPFAIGARERDAWLTHMRAAVDATGIADPARQAMLDYFEQAAHFLINQQEGTA
ncbi:MAG TPA: globin [Armatimonadota bacterium]|nr:globin [Armatimonadota bacterium]